MVDTLKPVCVTFLHCCVTKRVSIVFAVTNIYVRSTAFVLENIIIKLISDTSYSVLYFLRHVTFTYFKPTAVAQVPIAAFKKIIFCLNYFSMAWYVYSAYMISVRPLLLSPNRPKQGYFYLHCINKVIDIWLSMKYSH